MISVLSCSGKKQVSERKITSATAAPGKSRNDSMDAQTLVPFSSVRGGRSEEAKVEDSICGIAVM